VAVNVSKVQPVDKKSFSLFCEDAQNKGD